MIMLMRIILAAISFLIFPVGWALGAWQIFRKKNRIFGTVLIGLGTLELVLLILIFSSAPSVETDVEVGVVATPIPLIKEVGTDTPVPPAITPLPTPTKAEEKELERLISLPNNDGLIMGELEKEIAIMEIKYHDGVLDATIKQEDSTFFLGVSVYPNGELHAKEIGDNFVRLVKSFGPDDPMPRKGIGEGKFNYRIGIYHSCNFS